MSDIGRSLPISIALNGVFLAELVLHHSSQLENKTSLMVFREGRISVVNTSDDDRDDESGISRFRELSRILHHFSITDSDLLGDRSGIVGEQAETRRIEWLAGCPITKNLL